MVPLVDAIADRLADEMVGDAESGQSMVRKDLPALLAIVLRIVGAFHVRLGEDRPIGR